ncbi:hypothetical protein BDW22DRAFT_1364156 [Trametopsis cervina]|nr:hypothetical protein BDW22DRAFT_1364156 [Trametopsis cervina]
MEYVSGLNRVNDDVLALICAAVKQSQNSGRVWDWNDSDHISLSPLNALSLTCRRVRAQCVPYLFQQITLCCVADHPWARAIEMLSDWNPAHSAYVRELSIALSGPYVFSGPHDNLVEDLATTLADTLYRISKAATSLEALRVEIDEFQVGLFQAAFAARGLIFPGVRRLTVGPFNDYMVAHCPHTTMLAGNRAWRSRREYITREYTLRLFDQAVGLENLECFALRTLWDYKLLVALGEAGLHVRTLLIPGFLDWFTRFEALAVPLSLLPDVEVLSIPMASELNAGFEVPECDDEGSDSERSAWEAYMDLQRQEAEERVAVFVFEHCPGLRELWFDTSTKASRIQDERDRGDGGEDGGGLVWLRGDEVEPPPWAAWI